MRCALLYFIPYLIYFELWRPLRFPNLSYTVRWMTGSLFHEGFVIPYLPGSPCFAVSLGYFLFHSRRDFLDLCFIMFTGMTICLLIYTVLPNGLQLCPAVVRDNLFASIAGMLYAIDTPTNVCPSIHVSSTVAMILSCAIKVFSCGTGQQLYPVMRNRSMSFNHNCATAFRH